MKWRVNDAAAYKWGDDIRVGRVVAITSEGVPVVKPIKGRNDHKIDVDGKFLWVGRYRWRLFRGWVFDPEAEPSE